MCLCWTMRGFDFCAGQMDTRAVSAGPRFVCGFHARRRHGAPQNLQALRGQRQTFQGPSQQRNVSLPCCKFSFSEVSASQKIKMVEIYVHLQMLDEFYRRQNMGITDAPQLVFFKDAVEHVVRAARVFRQPGGHLLMVRLPV